MTKEIELAAEDAANQKYPYCKTATNPCYSGMHDAYKEGFLDCAQWMATRDRWVSVETAKPTDNHRYLIIDDDGGVSIDFYNLDENRFFCEEADDMFVTHFKELPSPPQSKNNG